MERPTKKSAKYSKPAKIGAIKKTLPELQSSKQTPVIFHIPSKEEIQVAFQVPPKMVYNDQGEMVEVILSYADYKTFLGFLADYADWEVLPTYLQDEVDHLLAEESRTEQGNEASTPLMEVLVELGLEPEEDVKQK